MRKYFIHFALILTLFACSQKPKLEGFNSDVWKNDKKGCEGKRAYLAEVLLAKNQQLRGMDDDDLVNLLGKPEATNWESRGRKTYYYFIQKGSQCDQNLVLEGVKLAVDFDALGRVHIITEKKF